MDYRLAPIRNTDNLSLTSLNIFNPLVHYSLLVISRFLEHGLVTSVIWKKFDRGIYSGPLTARRRFGVPSLFFQFGGYCVTVTFRQTDSQFVSRHNDEFSWFFNNLITRLFVWRMLFLKSTISKLNTPKYSELIQLGSRSLVTQLYPG